VNADEFKSNNELELYVKGAWDERRRIIAILEKLRDSEYAEVMSHEDVIHLIKDSSRWADSVQEMKGEWPD
jgi:hypothetical protein